ncbi:MAG: deoxyribodipyrimidine photolyase [Coleofasciculaceae cyanobacterium SM2_1_6]|nr:deoxyribodipyrimidine photolyase [Coleofasciculaceae cyanobacterium SM2_1_6]
MADLVLFWHRRDLRISDNVGLNAARNLSSKLIGLFCLDPQILDRDDMAPARVSYMLGCLQELQASYQQLGSELLIFYQSPLVIIPKLVEALEIKTVCWNLDVEPYGRERDRSITEALQGVNIQTYWDQILHAPSEIYSGSGTPYTVYTPFWKNWITKPKAAPLPKPQPCQGLTPQEREVVTKLGAIDLPTAEDLGFPWQGELFLSPGETAALGKLQEFTRQGILTYGDDRNYPALAGTSCLSPALKFGAIGLRTLWQATLDALAINSTEAAPNIHTWQQEIAWREFYHHALYNFPSLEQGAYRQQFQNFPWENNEAHFQAWCEGRTGYPIIDAAMRQLNTTGWMHNRCRMIVASFLTKDLIINWQWGEKYFMQKLIDGDLAANNGGWQWSASSGMDPKPLRIFNPYTQGKNYDPEAAYIRCWLPELKSLPTKDLLSGNILPLVRSTRNYPQPIVDHHTQQQEFKRRYALIKAPQES